MLNILSHLTAFKMTLRGKLQLAVVIVQTCRDWDLEPWVLPKEKRDQYITKVPRDHHCTQTIQYSVVRVWQPWLQPQRQLCHPVGAVIITVTASFSEKAGEPAPLFLFLNINGADRCPRSRKLGTCAAQYTILYHKNGSARVTGNANVIVRVKKSTAK